MNFALLGCVPLNVDKPLHDKVAAGMVLGFVGLLLTTPVVLRRMPRALHLSSLVAFAYLFAGAWLFVTGTVNLALFEVVAFSAMFGWTGILTASLTAVRTPAPGVARAASSTATPSPQASDVISRRRDPRARREAFRPATAIPWDFGAVAASIRSDHRLRPRPPARPRPRARRRYLAVRRGTRSETRGSQGH